jgi:hypothetical protein
LVKRTILEMRDASINLSFVCFPQGRVNQMGNLE